MLGQLPEEERESFINFHFNAYDKATGGVQRWRFLAEIRAILSRDEYFPGRDDLQAFFNLWAAQKEKLWNEFHAEREKFAEEQPVNEKPVELLLLEYGEKNAEVIRTLYEGLNGKLLNAPFGQWERLFIDNGYSLQPITWVGKTTQITTLFQGLKLRTSRIYRQIAEHFRKEGGGKFNPDGMAVIYGKAKIPQPLVTDLLEKVKDMVKT